MPYQEQIQKRHLRRSDEQPVGTFPEVSLHINGGDGIDDTDALLERIERDLEINRALGAATGVEVG